MRTVVLAPIMREDAPGIAAIGTEGPDSARAMRRPGREGRREAIQSRFHALLFCPTSPLIGPRAGTVLFVFLLLRFLTASVSSAEARRRLCAWSSAQDGLVHLLPAAFFGDWHLRHLIPLPLLPLLLLPLLLLLSRPRLFLPRPAFPAFPAFPL